MPSANRCTGRRQLTAAVPALRRYADAFPGLGPTGCCPSKLQRYLHSELLGRPRGGAVDISVDCERGSPRTCGELSRKCCRE